MSLEHRAEAKAPARLPLHPDEPTTLAEIFERVARDHRRSNTLNYKQAGAWHPISSDEMLARMRLIALGLHALGVRPGDRVAILSESRAEWVLADGGCLLLGATDVPIYPTLTPPQVRYILQDSGARVVFVSTPRKLAEVEEVLAGCAALEQVVLFETEPTKANSLSLSQMEARGRELEKQEPQLIARLARNHSPQDLATIIYTSGTTGEPKGVMLTHANLVSNLIDSAENFEFDKDDVSLSVLPLSHIFERQAMYMYLHHGMAVYFGESLEQTGVNMREVHPTVFVGVPRIFEKIYARIKDKAAATGRINSALLAWAVEVGKAWAQLSLNHKNVPLSLALKHKIASVLVFSKWREAMGGHIRIFVSGGAALSEEIGYIFEGAGLPIVQGYGLTETSPVITALTLDDNRIGTVGKPIRNVEIRLAPDGEIETRGPNIMQGYWNKPEQTGAVFTADGWFKTGDIGAIDSEGFLTLTDRKKELLKTSGGKYIAPQPIEQLIKGSRFVNQVILVGNDRKFPAALIVPDWERLESYARLKGIAADTHEELCRHPRIIDLFERQIASLTPDLAQYERVKRIALLPNELTIEGGEMTPTLKVKRRVIDEKYRDVIDRMYAEAESAIQAGVHPAH
ncbi:MAG: long-chain fatty acid--CoA ligase [Pyrinomonadaceae bacterium]